MTTTYGATTYGDNGSGQVTTVPPPKDQQERITNLQQALAEAESRAEEAERNLQRFKDQVVQVGNDYAERHDWCSTYDDIMRELGLPGRLRDYTVGVRIHATYQLTVQATDDDHAQEVAMEQAVSDSWRRCQPFPGLAGGQAYDVHFELAEELF